MKKLLTIILVLSLTAVLSISAFASGETADPQQAIEANISVDIANDTAVSASQAKDDIVQKNDLKSFKGKFTGLLAELNQLRVECKDLWSQIKSTNESIKTAWSSFRTSLKDKKREEVKKILAETKAKIEPLRTQVKALHADIKAIRAQKTVEWTNFRTAVKAKDEAKAAIALKNIITLKKQIIEKQKAILPLKQAILAAIK
jgi:predicted  nucleic acid-binding Zn-ribbon protein